MTSLGRDRHRKGRLGVRLLLALALGLVPAGCATNEAASPGAAANPDDDVNDPLETLNRAVFAVNDAIDAAVIRPVSIVYRDYVPQVFQDRVRDFLRNLRTPIVFANEVLQGDWHGAEVAATRFFVNSTLGVGGLIDIANYGYHGNQGYPFDAEDFGQTLAVWGVPEGPYLVLPLLGPSNIRDTAGFAVDTVGDPIGIAVNTGGAAADTFGYTTLGLTVPDRRAPTIEATDELERSSVDFYATIRSLYRRSRQADIRDGEAEETIVIPDYDQVLEVPAGGGADRTRPAQTPRL